jgi:signal transduction histidine kinase/DNA-binding response OmpR family regulator
MMAYKQDDKSSRHSTYGCRFVVSCLLLCLLVASCARGTAGISSPVARQGFLDLTHWNFARNGLVELKGEWEFYWNQLLAPQDFTAGKPSQSTIAAVPGSWSDVTDASGKKFPGKGYATYRLKIALGSEAPDIYLQRFYIHTAFRVFLNGVLVKDGKVGKTLAEEKLGRINLELFPLKKGIVNELIVQVSNHQMPFEIIMFPVNCGTIKQLGQVTQNHTYEVAFLQGSILIMALYHLGLFFSRRKDLSTLAFSLFCTSCVIYFLTVDWVMVNFMNEKYFADDSGSVVRIFKLSWYACVPFFNFYVWSLYPTLYNKKVLIGFFSFAILSMIFVLATPMHIYTEHSRWYVFFAFGTVLYVFKTIALAVYHKKEGALIFLAALIVLFLSFLNDTLLIYTGKQSVALMPLSVFCYIIAQALLISARFSWAFSRVEYLSTHLKQEVESQTHDLIRQKMELEQTHDQLKSLDKQKTYFFQNISHEIRTPLTLIMAAHKKMMQKSPHDQDVAVSMRNVKRLYRLVNQLLDFQRLGAAKKELKLVPLDLVGFVGVCEQYFRANLLGKGDVIRATVGGSDIREVMSCKKILINGDIDALEKIAFNYLSNALKFSPAKSSIELGLKEEGDSVRLFVKDEGPGIAKADQHKLFKVFSQVDETTTREYEGSGIGLALVKELAIKMGGTVGIESEPGQGALFWVELPRIKVQDEVIDLVCIDDDPDIGDFFSKELQRTPLRFEVVQNTKEARKLLAGHRVRAVISDQDLPLEDGASFLSFVEAEQPQALRFMYTGHTEPEFLQQLINIGHLHKIYYKPCSIRTICEEIVALLRTDTEGMEDLSLSNFTVRDWLLEDQAESQGKDNPTGSPSSARFASRPTILIVDDVKDLSNLMVGILEAHEFNTLVAANGADGMEIARSCHPDLIITDWMMPKVSGIDLIKLVREDVECSALPIVLLTAKSDDTSKKLAIQAGADSFLSKPFDELELISTVNNLLRLKSGEKKIAEHARAIKTILDNVKSGFFLIDREYRVNSGFSKSCHQLLNLDIKEQVSFLDAFELSPRSREGFEMSLWQVFEDMLPEKAALANLPTRVVNKGRIYSLEGSTVRDEKGKVATLLFTVNDITQLATIEEEHIRIQSLLSILNSKEAFRFFVADSLQRLAAAKKQLENKRYGMVKQSLHTMKGNASLFELVAIVNLINDIEEKESFDHADIDAVSAALRQFVEANRKILGMDLDTIGETVIGVTQSQLDRLGDAVLTAQSVSKVVEYFGQWYHAVSAVPIAVILGPIERSVQTMAKKLGKQIHFTVIGGDLQVVPHYYSEIFHDIIHLIRNAIDHGIEPASARGAKTTVGNVVLAFFSQGEQIEITVEDDGRGIDTQRVVQKAVQCGVVDAGTANELTESQIIDLIFLEKVSTAEDALFGISGRGVGMGAIKEAVARAQGHLNVSSRYGQGTKVTITLPYRKELLYQSVLKKAS